MSQFATASEVKVGVVGYGGAFNMGRGHLQQMQKCGMVPTAVCELDAERLTVARQDFPGIETYATVDEMLKKSKVNLVTIITPHNNHAEITLKCLKAGRNVVVEKPMALTTAECDTMIAAAKKARVVLSTYHNRHWDAHIVKAVELIKKGVIGDVFRVEAHMGGYNKPGDWWRSSKMISGGVLYDWGVHLLEYSFQILKGKMVEVSGHLKTGYWAPKTRWKKDTVEDEGFLVVRFDDASWLTLTISSLDARPKNVDHGFLEMTGTLGSYILYFDHYEIYRKDEEGVEHVEKGGYNGQDSGLIYYQDVTDHLVKGKPLTITAEWARRPIHVIDLAQRSAKMGKALPVKYT